VVRYREDWLVVPEPEFVPIDLGYLRVPTAVPEASEYKRKEVYATRPRVGLGRIIAPGAMIILAAAMIILAAAAGVWLILGGPRCFPWANSLAFRLPGPGGPSLYLKHIGPSPG
jgi:hypothetical protein